MNRKQIGMAVSAAILSLGIAACGGGGSASAPAPTVSAYSPNASVCALTGPGWVIYTNSEGVKVIVQVGNVRYCVGDTTANVFPVVGRPFNVTGGFTFSKNSPVNGN